MQNYNQQMREEHTNNEHLKSLSIFYFVFGGLSFFVAFVLIIYLVVIGFIFNNLHLKESINDLGTNIETPLNIITAIFIFAIILIIAVGILQIIAGLKLRKRTNRIFTLVVGVITLTSFPLGTALGIFTIIVLNRPLVIDMYNKQPELMKQKILNPEGLDL